MEITKPEEGKSIKMTAPGIEISWEYLGKQSSSKVQAFAYEEDAVPTTLDVESALEGALHSKGSKAVYENADKDTDIEYSLAGNNIKENIIIKEKAEEYKYLFALNTQGLKLRVSEDNESLELYTESVNEDGETKIKTEATIPAPFMYDANGESSDDVYFELAPETDGKYTFAVVASADWINEDGRAFPVIIDPQIVTEGAEYITKQVKYRTVGTGSSGSYTSPWYSTSSSYIKVQRSSSVEYMTTLTIKKSGMEFLNYPISSVKLILEPYRILTSGYCYINNSSVFLSSTAPKEVLITSAFKNAEGDFTVDVKPYGTNTVNAEFYASGTNAPHIEVEYLINGKSKRIVQQFVLAGGAMGQYDVVTGDASVVFEDIPASDSLLGVGISHVYKKSGENLYVGDNFRLNLHETLSKIGAAALDADYVYTDASGMKHGFKETFYYLNINGEKISVSKESITVDLDGRLFYIGENSIKHEVYKEQCTETGLRLIPKIENIKYSQFLEQRSDEQKQVEMQEELYRNNLEDYCIVNPRSIERDIGYIVKEFSFNGSDELKNDFREGLTSDQIIINKSEAYNYIDLCISLNELITLIAEEETKYKNIEDKQSDEAIALDKSINILKDKKSSAEQRLVWVQVDKKKYLLEQFDSLYKEYVNIKHQKNLLSSQLPVNYLTDGKIIKGFNEVGRLVAIVDNYENIITIEYDKNGKIIGVNEGESKKIVFEYRPDGLLGCITDARGRRTVYDYSDNALQKFVRSDGTVLMLNFTGDDLTEIKTYENETNKEEGKPNDISTVSKSGAVTTIVNKSGVSSIENGKIAYLGSTALKTLNTLKITQGSDLTTFFEEENKKNKYYRIKDEDKVEAYYEEENGKIVSAELYDYIAYEKDNVQLANRTALFTKAFAEFSGNDFVGGDMVNTVLDQFNNPATVITNARSLSNGTTKQITATYTYNDNHKCIKESALITVKEGATVLKTYTQVTEYNYNAAGNVVRKEIYVEGEEYTTGKSIEETELDEKGNVVRSFSYNSLDTSSKFYMESDYAENGQTLADYDATGENKTKYEYISGTNVVRSQKFPNGSKLAYGHDENDNVTSITQSTDEGEENSTQTRYTCGEVTEYVSGNNVVQYAYDAKRRLSKIMLNGTENYIQNTYTDNMTLNNVTVDKCVSKNAKGESVTSYTDKQGEVRRITTSAGKNIDYAYNAKGETTSVTDGVSGKTESYTYNETYDRLTGYSRGTEYTETYAYDKYGQISSITQSGAAARTYNYTYKENAARDLESITVGTYKFSPQTDKSGRNAGREIWKDSAKLAAEYIYYRKVGDHATNMPSSVYFGKKKGEILSISENIKYKYDTMGNICRIDENGEPVVWYKYDALNRLIREDNKTFGKTWLYDYDNNGNILCKRTTGFKLKENIEDSEFESVQYEYDGDKLLSYGTEACEYDAIGNPTKYCGKVVAWENGRQMVNYNGTAFTYDGLGRRLSKGNISYTYDSNNRVIKQSNGLEFFYDNTGVAGIEYNNATYLYQKDAQGNICKILDSNGGVIVQYKYDAWGNHAVLDANGADISDAAHIGKLNPYRYRGYYYDTETGLYYLKSRYYDPEVCRFITIDDIQILSISKEVINGLNLYCYCNNNPVNDKDESGYLFGFLLALLVGGIVGALVSVAGTFIGDIANNIWNYGFNFAAWEFSNWQTYLGAAIGGFVGGALGVAFPGSYVLVAGITGAASTLATNLLEIVSGVANYSVGEILANIVIDGLVSAAFGKLTQGFVVKGINAGRNSFQQVFKSSVTKAWRYGYKMSLKTAGKGFIYLGLSSFNVGWLLDSILGGVVG